MGPLAKYSLKLRYDGGSADSHQLPFYDGTTSIQGFAQSLQIATHAYLTGEIVSRATALRGAELFLKSSRKGSFLFDLVVLIEAYPIVGGLSALAFYDFLKIVLGKATGAVFSKPESGALKKLIEEDETFLDDLAEMLEGSLQRVHRPIGTDITTISLERPRSTLITFDQSTRDWVDTREEVPTLETVTGNVTRFNSVTRNGRIYIDQLRRIVPFKPDGDFSVARVHLLTWSLHGSANALPKKLELKVKHIKSATGETKRLLLSDCQIYEDAN